MARLRWLRWGDALLGWLVLLFGLSLLFAGMPSQAAMALAAGLLLAGALILGVRGRWGPRSGATAVVVSRRLGGGDGARFGVGTGADLVMGTAGTGVCLLRA